MGAMLVISSEALAALVREAARAAPRECCGLLLGREGRINRVRPADNVADEPATRFEIDPAALLAAHKAARAGGPELIGYYHSHPQGHPVPSATDRAHASGDARVWAIIARGEVAFWRDGAHGFEALPYRADDG